ncbi:hypothetical protein TNCV_3908421 [Trichonephila clavipes]|nr:hypothetical protein TNCV_3908421 [Trichonephila clavipes]
MRPSWSHKLKRDSSQKTTWCQSALQKIRRIVEADISTPVAVDQSATTAWRKLYGHSLPFGAGIDRRAQRSPCVVQCHFFEFFGARWSTASKLASLWNCYAAHDAPMA